MIEGVRVNGDTIGRHDASSLYVILFAERTLTCSISAAGEALTPELKAYSHYATLEAHRCDMEFTDLPG
jgi:hypothetical protein